MLILGDSNGDGIVESIDATVVQRRVACMEQPYSYYTLMHGDVDASGALEIYDVTCLQRYMVNLPTPYRIGEAIA